MLITRQAQTSTAHFLDYLGTDDLTIYHNGELKYGSFQGTIINQFTDDNFQQILNVLSDNVDDPPGNWEIRKGNTLLLSQHQNQLDLAIGTERLQQGLKQGDFSLGQALVGYWLIEDELSDSSPTSQVQYYYSAIKESMTLLSTVEADNSLGFTDTQQASVSSPSNTSNQRPNTRKHQPSLTNSHENSLSSQPPKETQSIPNSSFNNDLPLPVDNSSLVGIDSAISYPTLSQDVSELNQSNYLEHQAFLHHLFCQLAQQKRLRYYQGKAIFTINGDTLIAELNKDNQWQYVLGSLSQQSLHQLQSSSHPAEYSQSSVNSSHSLDSSSSQSSDLIL